VPLPLLALFRGRVGERLAPLGLRVGPGLGCAELVERMRAARASQALVVDADGRPLGIVTEQDVARRIAFAVAPQTPVERVMSRPVRTVRGDELLFHAIARMRRAGLRHLPVVDEDGRAIGVLRLEEALAAAGEGLLAALDRLTRADTAEGLAETKAAERELAAELLGAGVDGCQIQAVLSSLNDDLHHRVIERCLGEMRAEGRGGPPLAFEFLVMGSGGRGESFLDPDQDNALLLADGPAGERARADAWFGELAARVCTTLERVGFRRCRGGVMAVNPAWRKSLSEWRSQVARWMGEAEPRGLRMCDIFFDFRAVHGAGRLAARLREHVTAQACHPHFLRELYRVDEEHGVALGLLGRLRTDPLEGPHRGELHLKLSGTLPLVGAVRLLALRERIAETATLARIAALAARGVLERDEEDHLAGALRLLAGLVLRQQLADLERGREPGHHVPPAALTAREREALVSALRAVRRFRARVREELAVRL